MLFRYSNNFLQIKLSCLVLRAECERTQGIVVASPAKPPLPSHGDSTWVMGQTLTLDGFPGAQLRAAVWKSSDVLVLNRPSEHYGKWLQLSGATHAKTC